MKVLFLSSIAVVAMCSLSLASEVMMPAAQIDKGHGYIIFLYDHTREKINLTVSGRNSVTAGANTFVSDVRNDLTCPGEAHRAIAKVVLNPHDGLSYWLKAGVGSYEIEIPSQTVKNALSSDPHGYIFGIGLKKRLLPDTIVTPALSFELGAERSVYALHRMDTAGQTTRIDGTLILDELAASVTLSKAFRTVETYGGVNVQRTMTTLRDESALQSISGTNDGAGMFLGAVLKIYPHESIVLEGRYADELRMSAGYRIDF